MNTTQTIIYCILETICILVLLAFAVWGIFQLCRLFAARKTGYVAAACYQVPSSMTDAQLGLHRAMFLHAMQKGARRLFAYDSHSGIYEYEGDVRSLLIHSDGKQVCWRFYVSHPSCSQTFHIDISDCCELRR